jgi:hypothetical protein
MFVGKAKGPGEEKVESVRYVLHTVLLADYTMPLSILPGSD